MTTETQEQNQMTKITTMTTSTTQVCRFHLITVNVINWVINRMGSDRVYVHMTQNAAKRHAHPAKTLVSLNIQ